MNAEIRPDRAAYGGPDVVYADLHDDIARAIMTQAKPPPACWLMIGRGLASLRELGIEVTEDVAVAVARRAMRRFGYAAEETPPEREAFRPPPHRPEYPGDRHGEVVYYVQLGTRVKIGTTTQLRKRLLGLGGAERVLAVEVGGRDVEGRRHATFRALRVVGEWFSYEEPLASFIKALPPPPKHLQWLVR